MVSLELYKSMAIDVVISIMCALFEVLGAVWWKWGAGSSLSYRFRLLPWKFIQHFPGCICRLALGKLTVVVAVCRTRLHCVVWADVSWVPMGVFVQKRACGAFKMCHKPVDKRSTDGWEMNRRTYARSACQAVTRFSDDWSLDYLVHRSYWAWRDSLHIKEELICVSSTNSS